MLNLTKMIDLYEKHELGYQIMNGVYSLGTIVASVVVGANMDRLGAWFIPLLVIALANLAHFFRLIFCIDWGYKHGGSGRYYKYIVFRFAILCLPILFPYWICMGIAIPLDSAINAVWKFYLFIRDKLVDPNEEE